VPVILISRHFEISMGKGARACEEIHTYVQTYTHACIPTYILTTRCIHEAFSALNFDLLSAGFM